MALLGLRASYTVKHVLVLLCIILDLVFNSAVDSSDEKVTVLALFGTQAVVRVLLLFIMMASMWNTFVFKYGLLGALCSRFKLLVFMFPISFLLMLGVEMFTGGDIMSIWESDLYQALYVLHNLLSIVFYVSLLQACFDLGNPAFYKASSWLER